MKKLLIGPLMIVLGLAAVGCGGSPTLLPTGTATATPPASAAAGISSTPPASPAAAVSSTPPASGATGSTPQASAAAGISATPPASPAAAVGSTQPASAASAHDLLLSAGTYGVSTAIPAGTYNGQSLSEDSHYRIATDPNGKNIVAKSPRLTGQFSLTLTKGQYLVVSGVMKITKVK